MDKHIPGVNIDTMLSRKELFKIDDVNGNVLLLLNMDGFINKAAKNNYLIRC